MELIEFLNACLDEDERLVHAVEEQIGPYRAGEPYDDGSGIAKRDAYPSYPWGLDDAELKFMSRWHPRSVLDDVAAKRAILAIHGPFYDFHDTEKKYPMCSRCEDGKQELVAFPCETTLALASAYRHRDGWREEWR